MGLGLNPKSGSGPGKGSCAGKGSVLVRVEPKGYPLDKNIESRVFIGFARKTSPFRAGM